MPIDPELLEVLACVESKRPLLYVPADGDQPEALLCQESRLRYSFDPEGGFPVLLIDEAVRIDDEAEFQALLARAKSA
ncbi:MAG: Trm112 family protein [Deltaproteobacteria bacterium]|nr:Trm112 family protein [Deltaproteobacteria bacterium]